VNGVRFLLQTEGEFIMGANFRSRLVVEELESRCTPSAVTPANGQEFGTSTIGFVQSGVNIGKDVCSIEKGECAADAIAFLSPPGQR
jgi:hypothetical protein